MSQFTSRFATPIFGTKIQIFEILVFFEFSRQKFKYFKNLSFWIYFAKNPKIQRIGHFWIFAPKFKFLKNLSFLNFCAKYSNTHWKMHFKIFAPKNYTFLELFNACWKKVRQFWRILILCVSFALHNFLGRL